MGTDLGPSSVTPLSLSNMWVSAQQPCIMNEARDVIETKGLAAIGRSHSAHPYWLSSEAFCFGAGMRILTPDPGEHCVPKTCGQNAPFFSTSSSALELAAA